MPPCGYLPALPGCTLESRHLGLVTAQEVDHLKEKMQRLAQQAEQTLELDRLLQLANEAPALCFEPLSLPEAGTPVRIGVARDRAFCFYYEDSLNLLRRLGANLIDFSPLHDNALPEDLDGLYLGGGYPELYAQALSGNETMRQSIREAVCAGLPCIAECGGFMYLTEAIGGCPMAGVLPGSCFDTGKLTRFGYVTLTASKDNLLCRAGQSIPAHEFHHWDAEQPGSDFTAEKPSGRRWTCAVATDTLYAGFPHFHFTPIQPLPSVFWTPAERSLSAMPEQLKPMDIEARSFEIITELLGDRKLDPENALVIKRAIHTTADFDYADNLVFSPHAVQKGIEALKAGCDIVTDTQMARARHQQNGAGKPRRRGPLLHVGCGRCAGGSSAA